MGNSRWPAIVFQSIFLASNISYLLAGKNDVFIIASTSVIVLLFTLQTLSNNPRFLYLFPVNRQLGRPDIRTPSWDTRILRGLIVLSILFFYIGATGLYVFPCLIIGLGLGFPFIWDQYIESHNRRRIDRLLRD